MICPIIRNISHFPISTVGEFSLGYNWIRFAEGMRFISDLEKSLGKRPLLFFKKYSSPIYKTMCNLCEFKFVFSLTYNG